MLIIIILEITHNEDYYNQLKFLGQLTFYEVLYSISFNYTYYSCTAKTLEKNCSMQDLLERSYLV